MINKNSVMAKEYVESENLPRVLDFHAHFGNMVNAYMPYGEPEKMLELMDRANVRCTIFASHNGLYMGNRFIKDEIKVCEKYPGRFKIYMTVFSRYYDFKKDIKCLESNKSHIVGFKFHPGMSGIKLDDKRNTPYWEYADENNLLVLIHSWQGMEKQTENILKKYHNLKMVGGHSFFGNWDFASYLANTYENFYPELTAVMAKRGALERIVKGCGSDKILFGTDMPWFSYYYYIGAILSADIEDTDRKNILWNNGNKLLNSLGIEFDG